MDTPRSDPPPGEPDVAWIETRAGGLFFANALLVAPAATVLLPVLLGQALRAAGLVEGPSPMLDTVPRMADYFVPRVGWLAAPAAWLAWKGVRVVDRSVPRVFSAAFLLLHLGTLSYTVWRWVAA